MTEQYTPSLDEVCDHFAYGCGPEHTWRESREAFDRWLAAVRAEEREKAVADLRWLGDARGEYTHEVCQAEARTARHLAEILTGENDACGWLPSWLWGEWEARIREQGEEQDND